MKNKKKFGLISIILLGMNAIIGSGIFLLPGQAYDLVGTSSLFVFLFRLSHLAVRCGRGLKAWLQVEPQLLFCKVIVFSWFCQILSIEKRHGF